MNQTRTASEELAYIEKYFFKKVGLAKACSLEGEERRDYRLAQVDRLLTEMHGGVPKALWLSDMFWTGDKGRILPEKPTPLLLLKEQQTLTDKEMGRVRLILEIAGLCHDLSIHFTFDLEEAFGIKSNNLLGYSDFGVSNKQLVEWLTTTKYEHIAMHTAYIMKKVAISVYEYGHYQPAQDELAELFSLEYNELIREPEFMERIPPRAYVQIIIDAMLRIERHWQRGLKRKLKPDVIILHDEIYGVIPRQFDKGVLQAAQALYDYLDNNVYGRLVGNNPFGPEAMKLFAKKVREVRSKYLAEGWIADDSLEFAYLMAHAQNCGYGFWREEDEAL